MKLLITFLCLTCLACVEYENENNAAVSGLGSTEAIALNCAEGILHNIKKFSGWHQDSVEYCKDNRYIKCIIYISKPEGWSPKPPWYKGIMTENAYNILWFSGISFISIFIFCCLFQAHKDKQEKKEKETKETDTKFKTLFKG